MVLSKSNNAAGNSQLDSFIWIRLLGGFALFKEGTPVLMSAGTKAEALLSLLAIHHNDGLSREALIHLLWPDQETMLAIQSLNTLTSSLRRQLGSPPKGTSWISYDGETYQINHTVGVGIDILHFDYLVELGNQEWHRCNYGKAIESYDLALKFYHGDLRNGLDIYAVIERERLRASYLNVLACLANYYFDQHLYAMSLDHAQRLIAKDPCREDAHRLMMRCYVYQGQRAQALRHYHFCQSVLNTEFAIAPEMATTALYEKIRQTPESI